MNHLNSVIVEGNLTHDVRLRELGKGSCVCDFSIASNRYYRDREGEIKDEVSFFDIETWGENARQCHEQLGKGCSVKVIGRLKQDRWQGKEEQLRTKIKIVAEHVEILRSKKAEDIQTIVEIAAEEKLEETNLSAQKKIKKRTAEQS